jgi:hypothetical protein
MGGWELQALEGRLPPHYLYGYARSLKFLIAQRRTPRPAHLVIAGLILLTGCASRPPTIPQPKPTFGELSAPKAALPPGPLTVNTPIETICASPAGKAVLDRDLPGLTTRPEFPMFKAMTLKQIEPMSKGHITDAVLAKIQRDLASVNAGAEAK